MKLALRPSFRKDLDALKQHHRANHRKVCEILVGIQSDSDISVRRRPDQRIPHCVKYELADGYRVVFQQVRDSGGLIALAVGTHDRVDGFLDGHKGHVFDPSSGRLKELRLASSDEASVEVVSSAREETGNDLETLERESLEAESSEEAVFADFDPQMLTNLGVPVSMHHEILELKGANSVECTLALGRLEDHAPQAAGLLLAFATGNSATRTDVIGVAGKHLQYREQLSATDFAAVEASPDEFLTFSDPSDLEAVLERATREDWQLFLHPDQKDLVYRDVSGPSRIRGISGSGKTVVGLHRTRHLAKKLWGSSSKVLFTTFNRALAEAAGTLLDTLCGDERQLIEVTHLHRWCLEFLRFRNFPPLRYTPDDQRASQQEAHNDLPRHLRAAIDSVPSNYIWSEIEFIMGRFLHEDAQAYLTTDRGGRGRRLTELQREAILHLYRRYMDALVSRGVVDPADFVRIAYRKLLEGEEPESDYGAVIVDEVQDLSEISLRLLHTLVPDKASGLLLIGDDTQRIFTRGFSMRDLEINISGRSVVLRKNYRNTRQILEAAFPLVSEEWEDDARTAGLDPAGLRPEFSVREGCRPIVVRCEDLAAEMAFLYREIRFLLTYDRYEESNICVMARNRFYRGRVADALQGAGIPFFVYGREGNLASEIGNSVSVWLTPCRQGA